MAVSKLVTFRRWLIGWIKNPWVDMVIGIFVLITAILEFAVEETHQLSGAKGLFLLGRWVVLKATLRLLESVDLLMDSAQHFYKKEKPRFLLRFNFIALIHIMIAILLVVIGVSEAIQEFDSEVALSQVWHWNLVLVGAMIMVKTMGELMDAIYFASKAAKKNHGAHCAAGHSLVAISEDGIGDGVYGSVYFGMGAVAPAWRLASRATAWISFLCVGAYHAFFFLDGRNHRFDLSL
ncbi:hypothetical protein DC58_15325 [Vibrio navarrensis]|uniref:hypothetical protein n=1 Tax=Vibrio navarrensis TaxID=29495 RepID=UPI00052D6D5F|nr:hypothetical protein [Vibrio navarrensis]KGK21612.1 hypothetical protein DC58_15325 [Vibrio navarrensis]